MEVRLKELRERKGLSQNGLARALEMSLANVQKIEYGKAKAIPLDTLEKLCLILDCEVGDLLVLVKPESKSVPVEPTSSRRKGKSASKHEPMALQPGQIVKIPGGARAWVDKLLENGRVALTVEGVGKDEYPIHLLTATDLIV